MNIEHIISAAVVCQIGNKSFPREKCEEKRLSHRHLLEGSRREIIKIGEVLIINEKQTISDKRKRLELKGQS